MIPKSLIKTKQKKNNKSDYSLRIQIIYFIKKMLIEK